jgi:branched-chain amino acid transport system substrate-binding protein
MTKPVSKQRRSLLQAIAAGSATTFMGPWAVNHAWAQAAAKKPLTIGLTMDASGSTAPRAARSAWAR